MRVPCKVKIHHHGCFWMYMTCFSSRRRVNSRLPTFDSLAWFPLKKILLILSNYARLYLEFIYKKNYVFQFFLGNILFLLDQICFKELCRDSTYGQNLWFHPDYTLDLYIHRCLNEKTLENLYVWMFFQVIGAR